MSQVLQPFDSEKLSIDFEISPDEIYIQIGRILNSEGLKKSLRLHDFLTYIVDETLEGRSAELNGIRIAKTVFAAGESFDPESNSIVRVEAGRLRQRLTEYYADAGQFDPILISIPKGSYEPRFNLNPESVEERSARSSNGRFSLSNRETWLAIGIITIAIGFTLYSRFFYENVSSADSPRVQLTQVGPGPKSEAQVLFEQAFIVMIPPDDSTRLGIAVDMFESVIEADSAIPEGYSGKSIALSLSLLFVKPVDTEQLLSEAIALAKQSISIDREYGLSYAALALAQSFGSDTSQVMANVRHAVAIQRDDAITNSMASIALLNVGATREAIELLNEALRLNPGEPRTPYMNLLGIAHFANGDFARANEYFEKNLARNGPAGPHMDIFRAAAFAQLGRDFQARSMIERLNTDYPDYPVEGWLRNYIKSDDDLQATVEMLQSLGLSN